MTGLELSIIQVVVSDWVGMLKFYTHVLGLEAISIEHDHGYAWLNAPPLKIALKKGSGVDGLSVNRRIAIQFQVPNIMDAISYLESNDVVFDRKELKTGEHYAAAHFSDPEGNQIAIFQLGPTPKE